MTALAHSTPTRRLGAGPTIIVYGLLQFAVYGVSAFLVEKYSGGCMFVIPAFFYALVTMIPILRIGHFGVGLAIFLPCAVLGGIMDYWIEWVSTPALRGPGYAAAWALIFLGYGLAADLAYRFAPSTWSLRRRAILTGAVFGLGFYLLTLFALTTFYASAPNTGHLRYFQSGVYFSLPWMVVNGAFAGLAASALSNRT